jgi:hypothetical protein
MFVPRKEVNIAVDSISFEGQASHAAIPPPVVITTGQYEMTMKAGLGNEWCQQRCRELNRGPGRGLHHRSLDGTTAIT